MSNRFSYVKYGTITTLLQAEFKKRFEDLESLAETSLFPGRYKALFLTALEEAYMWTGKSLRDKQIELDGGECKELSERNNE